MFSADVLAIDVEAEIARIGAALRSQVLDTLKRRGVVVGISGGIDSSVTAGLAARALGRERVLGLLLPELHSSDEALVLGRRVASSLGIEALVEDLCPALDGLNCYGRLEEGIRKVIPEYGPGWKSKLVLPSILHGERLSITRLTVQNPSGETRTLRLTAEAYSQIVAASNFKQRVRKVLEYYHADRLQYAVAGTPNRLEYDQGFFVKQGDGAADVKPIAHLYKTQVYALAKALGIPEGITSRPPTTDTFSLPQTQEEFYFALPYAQLDLCLYGKNHGVPPSEVAAAVGLDSDQVERVYRDIDSKRRATRYLHSVPLLVEAVSEL